MAEPAAVLVASRIHDWRPQPAWLVDRVLMRDEVYQHHAGPRRYFWLLDEGVQLVYEPFGWRHEWYVDVVAIDHRPTSSTPTYHITDEYVDILIEGMGPTYRMLDLDELVTAVRTGRLGIRGVEHALVCAQRFIDRYLHRGAPFPPPQIRDFFSAEHRYPPLPAGGAEAS